MGGAFEAVETSAAALRPLTAARGTRVAIVLGSGLSAIADEIAAPEVVRMRDVPGFPVPSVAGHEADLVFGELGGVPCVVLRGRVHLYEGYSASRVVHAVRSVVRAGVRDLVLTNAAGSLVGHIPVDSVMMVTDHLNRTHTSPFICPDVERFGARFPVMAEVYDAEYIALAREVARETGIDLREGVYAGLAGPEYETPAEAAALRVLGAHAVGMSTVLEAMAARHMGARVAALSTITNFSGSAGDGHSRVLDEAAKAMPQVRTLLLGLVKRLPVR